MASPALDAQVEAFFKANPFFETETVKGKLIARCVLTKHEMPCQLKTLEQHIKGKKFIMARDCYSQDFSKYEPNIVPNKRNPHKLYCTVTKQYLNKIPKEIEQHIKGKHYLHCLKEKQQKEAKKQEIDARKAKKDANKESGSGSEESGEAESGFDDDAIPDVSAKEDRESGEGESEESGEGEDEIMEEEDDSEISMHEELEPWDSNDPDSEEEPAPKIDKKKETVEKKEEKSLKKGEKPLKKEEYGLKKTEEPRRNKKDKEVDENLRILKELAGLAQDDDDDVMPEEEEKDEGLDDTGNDGEYMKPKTKMDIYLGSALTGDNKPDKDEFEIVELGPEVLDKLSKGENVYWSKKNNQSSSEEEEIIQNKKKPIPPKKNNKRKIEVIKKEEKKTFTEIKNETGVGNKKKANKKRRKTLNKQRSKANLNTEKS